MEAPSGCLPSPHSATHTAPVASLLSLHTATRTHAVAAAALTSSIDRGVAAAQSKTLRPDERDCTLITL